MDSLLASFTNSAFKLATQLLREPADAQDVLQDAVAIAISHKNVPSLQSDEFKPWFFSVVRNKAIDRLRQQKRQPQDQFDEAIHHTNNKETLETAIENQQSLSNINMALAKLPIKQKEIIMLKDFHDFSYQDIANILNIPKGSVMSQLHRARLALRQLLQEHTHE